MKRSTVLILVAALLAMGFRARVEAEETSSAQEYSGDLLTRSTLTGDWGGARNDLAARGMAFELSLTQIVQGVVSGGKDGSWEYGGRGNFTGHLDTQKLGLWPGGFLTLEVEGNFADSINANTGALMAANSSQLYPEPTGANLNVPQLSFAQFLSPYAGLVIGKLDTTSGDANEFAHGKGDTQFLNLAFNFNPVPIVATPYSTLGVGAIVLPTQDPDAAILSFSVLQATGTASTSGFGDLAADKLTFAGEGRVRTALFGLSGHQLVGAGYSNKTFTSLDNRLGFILENQRLERVGGSWVVYYNFDQYVYETDTSAGHGVGLFGRFGASGGDPNPMQYFFSLGVGGKGIIRGRPNDRLGLGYYYLDIDNPRLRGPVTTRTFLRDEWGFEAFYNLAVTPWLLVTPDIQVVGPAQKRRFVSLLEREHVDTAVILGLRLQLIF